jgi:hypothetical protein
VGVNVGHGDTPLPGAVDEGMGKGVSACEHPSLLHAAF